MTYHEIDAEAQNELAWGEAENRAEYVDQYEAAEMRKIREAEAMNEIEREWENRHRPAPTAEEVHQQWHAVNGWLAVCPLDCGASEVVSDFEDADRMEPAVNNTATEKQIALINKLKAEKELDELAEATLVEMRKAWAEGRFSKKRASQFIDGLMRLPRKKIDPAAEAPEGFHRLGVDIFKVVRSRQGFLYAKQLVVKQHCTGHLDPTDPSAFDAPLSFCDGSGHEAQVSWERAPGAVRKLSPATLLSIEEAAEFGKATGQCLVCGRTLTDPESIARGIGPICMSRLA